MVDTSFIDTFLAKSLRAIRNEGYAQWPIKNNIDWQTSDRAIAVWERIDFHGIAVLLFNGADRLENWPDDLVERISEEARLIALWETTHRKCVGGLIVSLHNACIETVLMKGTSIAYSLYDDPSARRRGDSDLLVNPADLDRTRVILAKNGWYKRTDPHGLSFQETWLHNMAEFFIHSVDLHWEPSDRPVLQRILSRVDYFENRRPLNRFAKGAYGSDIALTVVHAAINQNWHGTHGYFSQNMRLTGSRRLIWSIDFDLLVRNLDLAACARLINICLTGGVGPLVASTLRWASEDLGTSGWDDLIERLDAGVLDADISRYLATKDDLEEFLLDLRTANTWKFKLSLIKRRGLPPRTHLIEKFPAAKGWPTILLQGRFLFAIARRLLKRVVSS